MTPHGGHGGGRGRGGYGYPLLYGYPPYIDVDDIAVSFKKSDSDKSELQKQADKLDSLTKQLSQTPIIQSNLRAAIQLEMAKTRSAIKKLSETSSFDASTNQQPKIMGTSNITVGSTWIKKGKSFVLGGTLIQHNSAALTSGNTVIIDRIDTGVADKIITYRALTGAANGLSGKISAGAWNANFSPNTQIQSSAMNTSSNFDGSSTINSKTVAIPAVGAVAGYFIGKKLGFSPLLSALVAGIGTFFINKKMMASKAAGLAAAAKPAPDLANPASIKPADNGSTNILTAGIGKQGDSFFSYANENLDDEILFSSVEGAGGSEASYAHNCPACMSGKNCDQPFHSDYCDKLANKNLSVNPTQNTFGSAPAVTSGAGLTGISPMKKTILAPNKKIAPMSKGGF